MILVISEKESAALTLHMSIMRKSFRNLIKARYKARRDDLNKSYDYLLQIIKDALESKNKTNEIHLNILDLEVLCEFLNSYTSKLAKFDLKDMDLEQLEVMEGLHLRCRELMAA